MKTILFLTVSLCALNLTPVFGQPAPAPAPTELQSPPQLQPPGQSIPTFQQRLQSIIQPASPTPKELPALTKFNLDFPGGTPADLVKAIEKAAGKPLNAIIPTEDADTQLPPLKMNDVVVPQLFAALKAASVKTITVPPGRFGGYSQFTGGCGFQTADGPLSDTSIWYFRVEKPSLTPLAPIENVLQFYSLASYLNHGFTVDDITTAIQTGWKMAGVTSPPDLSYHKETKMLIAFGEPGKLLTIQDVLKTLPEYKVEQADITYINEKIISMQRDISFLTSQLQDLKQTNSALTNHVAPEEKSGK